MESPCRNICELDQHDVCTGCGRTLDEIATWGALGDAERRAIMARLEREFPADPEPPGRGQQT